MLHGGCCVTWWGVLCYIEESVVLHRGMLCYIEESVVLHRGECCVT